MPKLRDIGHVLLGELVDELSELIVRAGDRSGALAALRATVGADLARLERLITELNPTKRQAGDRALVAAYLIRLVDRLNIDPWALRDRAADPARLDAIQQRLALNGDQRNDDQREPGPILVDELVESCHRLVIFGGPGSGKSWSARRAVIRAARAALDIIEALDPEEDFDQFELPLVATCAEVLEPSDQQRWDGVNSRVTLVTPPPPALPPARTTSSRPTTLHAHRPESRFIPPTLTAPTPAMTPPITPSTTPQGPPGHQRTRRAARHGTSRRSGVGDAFVVRRSLVPMTRVVRSG